MPCVTTISSPQAVHSLYSPSATRSLDVIPAFGNLCILWSDWLQTLNIVLTGGIRQPHFHFAASFPDARTHPSNRRANQHGVRCPEPKVSEFDWPRNIPAAPPPQRVPISSDSAAGVKGLIVTDSCTPYLVVADCGKRGQRLFSHRRGYATAEPQNSAAGEGFDQTSPQTARKPALLRRPCDGERRCESRPGGPSRQSCRSRRRPEPICACADLFRASGPSVRPA